MSKFTRWLVGAVFVVMAGLGAGVAHADDDRHGMENDIDVPTDAQSLAIGKDRYQARCSYCHRPDGRGGSSSVCLACQKYKWGSKSSAIYATIAAGRPYTKMGAFATSLTQEEIFSIIGYIRELQEWKLRDDKAAAK